MWTELMGLALIGFAVSMVGVALTAFAGMRYHRYTRHRHLYDKLETLQLRIGEMQEEYDELAYDLGEAQRQIREADERSAWMKNTQEEVADLENRKKELDDVEQELNRTNEAVAKLESRLSELRVQHEEIERNLERQRAELLDPAELERTKAEQRDLLGEVEGLKRRREQLAPEVETLETRTRDLVTRRDELTLKQKELEADLAGMEKRRESLEKQLEDLKESKVQVGGPAGAESFEESTKMLWEPAFRADHFEEMRKENESEESALQKTEEHIRSAGFLYDRRVIRAFHTALKCSAEAPLLVLAGISGTGKSALPTRYAEAMGMHFLPVPVQPGWDSPADLLGFYNHLEGRFRPTELTRALLQMDYIHRPAGEGEVQGPGAWPSVASTRTDLSDRMLLVLLDEMNLARIEYYFSEFLSRLEMRRDVNPADQRWRDRAEILLDLGTAGEGVQQGLRVFPGYNVLFAGTMNEDESTQTLSDKVIDRSNVLRFGRPNRLIVEDAGEHHISPNPDYLSRRTWQRWVDSRHALEETERNQVRERIGKLNQLLDRIGRPFAHRVAEAMMTYVRQYPDRSEQGLRDAFADQIELRVLPRLRGLDIHEPGARGVVEQLSRMVRDDLVDAPLADALDAAQRHSADQLFHWNGVDRLQQQGAGV